MKPTDKSSVLWEYIESESNELLIQVLSQVQYDGYTQGEPNQAVAAEVISLKVLSAALIKTLILLIEKLENPDLSNAYLQMTEMQMELIKVFMLKELRQKKVEGLIHE